MFRACSFCVKAKLRATPLARRQCCWRLSPPAPFTTQPSTWSENTRTRLFVLFVCLCFVCLTQMDRTTGYQPDEADDSSNVWLCFAARSRCDCHSCFWLWFQQEQSGDCGRAVSRHFGQRVSQELQTRHLCNSERFQRSGQL
jgi:hypothetical protein